MHSLDHFPDAFMPLMIIAGDRRETPPKCKGDVLAYSVSTTDFMYLTHLHLQDCPILSDKQFVIDSEEDLRTRFGSTNLLVIGSPAVNLLARRINSASMFRFAISDETHKQLKEQNDFLDEFIQVDDDFFIYQQCLAGDLDIDSIVERYVGMAPNIDALRERAQKIVPAFRKTAICHDLQTHPRPLRYLLHQLDKPGIQDGIAPALRGESIGPYKDYGLISVLKNPFASHGDYHVVYVAGVHGPGTAQGIRLLADRHRKSFEHHPYGGVYDLNINRFATYFEKIQKSPLPQWETQTYTAADYSSASSRTTMKMKAFLSSPGKRDDVLQKDFNGRLVQLLTNLCSAKGVKLEMEQPYTIALAPKLNFWDAILDWEKHCRFVIHDMTGFARGVMVEIGFSYAARRLHCLIWNVAKAPMELHASGSPTLLPVENIEAIDLADIRATTEVLEKRFLNNVLSAHPRFECKRPVNPVW